MRFSLICCRVGRRPSNRRLRRNSGAKGNGALRKSLFSVARLFTFQWLNSLKLWIHLKVNTHSSTHMPTQRIHCKGTSGYKSAGCTEEEILQGRGKHEPPWTTGSICTFHLLYSNYLMRDDGNWGQCCFFPFLVIVVYFYSWLKRMHMEISFPLAFTEAS